MVRTLRGLFLRHWKVFSLVSIVFLTSVSGAYAYWRLNAQSSSTPYSTAVSPPLELRLELDKTQFQLGETVMVHISLTNIEDKDITVNIACLGRYGFLVKDENDTIIHRGGALEGCATSVENLPLPAGSKIERRDEWPQIRNKLPWDPVTQKPTLAPPSTYKITARTLPFSILGTDISSHGLETPPLTITITS